MLQKISWAYVYIAVLTKIMFMTTVTYADSFDDLIFEVSADSGESVSTSRRVVLSTFKKITDRLKEDRATSIPEFARFYTQDKEKKSQKDKEGYWISPKTVRFPKCTILNALKKKLERTN